MFDVKSYVADAELQLKRVGVSVSEVARRAGIDRSTWTVWKKGKVQPNTRTIGAVDAELKKALAAPDEYRQARPDIYPREEEGE